LRLLGALCVFAVKSEQFPAAIFLDKLGASLYYLSVVGVRGQKKENRSGLTVSPAFSGHETFPFRYAWLKKGVDAVIQNPSVFSDDRAMIVLGVGKNMVHSIRHWCWAARLIEEETNSRSNYAATLCQET
jgi:hypothetical protein